MEEHTPQPVGKETSHSLKYIVILAFFIAWTGLVGFVGYQLKVVVDYIGAPTSEVVDEEDSDSDEEVKDTLTIEEDGDAVLVEYDYDLHTVTTELRSLFWTDAQEGCYRFTSGAGDIESRMDPFYSQPDYEPIGGWAALDAFESPRPGRDSYEISHFCLTSLGNLEIYDYDDATWVALNQNVDDPILSLNEELSVGHAASILAYEGEEYLVLEYGDAGVSVWEIYHLDRDLFDGELDQAELIESCTQRDTTGGFAILDCDVYGELVIEDAE